MPQAATGGGKIGDGRSYASLSSRLLPFSLLPRARLNTPRVRPSHAEWASFGGKTAKIARAANDKEAPRRRWMEDGNGTRLEDESGTHLEKLNMSEPTTLCVRDLLSN